MTRECETIIAKLPPQDGRDWYCQCARCGSSAEWEHCQYCEDGFDGHDCGEDCCCCLYPEENVICQICNGNGGWRECCSSSQWCQENPLPGRENVLHGALEWFTFDKPSP